MSPTWQRPPRRRRGGPLLGILGGLAAVVLIGGAAALGLLLNAVGPGSAPTAAPPPTVAPQPPGSGTTEPADPADPPGPGPDPGVGPADISYDELADHVLLTADDLGLSDAPCELAPFGISEAELDAHWNSAIDCLDELWSPVLGEVGIPHQAPQVVVAAEASSVSSPCTDSGGDFAAFYCPMNHAIYLPMDTMMVDAGAAQEFYLFIVAHEYGHHVQMLTGMLDAQHEHTVRVGHDSPRGLESLRRTELQAECFGGMYIGAQQAAGVMNAGGWAQTIYVLEQQGPADTHGEGAVRAVWADAGYVTNRTASCNTYAASEAEVAAE